MVVNVKDPSAGLTQVFYYTSRGTVGNGHMVILDDNPPLTQDFVETDLARPYGIAIDTAHKKVYITDYSNKAIYRYNSDGTLPQKILDANVPGQELVGDAEAIFVLGDKIYWGRTGGIYKANLDGSNPEVHIDFGTGPPEYPIDMQYDPATNKIYFVNDKTDYSGGYWSVNFDGSGMTEIIPDVDGTAIEMDFRNGKAYLVLYAATGTVATENGVYLCNIDGTSLTKIGDYGAKATWGITLDEKRNKIIWGFKESNSAPDGKIIRANLDGSGPEDWITGVSPHAMTVVWIKL
jgi:DNA-binding beta-propeller fold protein YncE